MAVTLTLDGNRPQRRITVAFRIILAIPHFLFGSVVLGTIAVIVIAVAWLVALITARVPTGIHDLLGRILGYQARMLGYGQMLLTDRYPPFRIGPADHPVEIEIEPPDRFNRAAVLFRAVLQLPALFLAQLVGAGLTVILVVVWLIALISGRLPNAAYMALASVLRYQMRTYAYVGLLTTEYPGGLFGDRDEEVPRAIDASQLPESPRITRLVLTRASKNLILLAIVIGAVFQVVNTTVSISSFTTGLGTARELAGEHRELESAVEEWSVEARSCSFDDEPDCMAAPNAGLRDAVERFERSILLMELPEGAHDEAARVVADLEVMREVLSALSATTDQQEAMRLSFMLEDATRQLDEHYDELYDAVLFSGAATAPPGRRR